MKATRPKAAPVATQGTKGASSDTLVLDDARFEALVSIQRLRSTWKLVRKEARDHQVRDVLDFVDWARSIDDTLPALSTALLQGTYAPQPPARYERAKSKGSFRVVTLPTLRDALVLRLLSDEALVKATPQKVQGAFFSRRHSPTPVGKTLNVEDDPYLRFFEIWMRYQQYRTRSLLNAPYEVLVILDISNFFESISHELLMEYLSPLGLPRKAIGLLGRLLEALKPATGHSPNPRIGIPVDDFDCSRQLAHIFLFEHDRRVASIVGEQNYVRWMDDQSVGVEDEAAARRVVNEFTRSLSLQRLTLNADKTRFLDPAEVADYFQLDANEAIDQFQREYLKDGPVRKARCRAAFKTLWAELDASSAAGKGQWEKILKRLYLIAAQIGSVILDSRMAADLVRYPELDNRIFSTLSRRDRALSLLRLFRTYCREWGSLYESTEATLFDASLLASMTAPAEKQWRRFALRFVAGQVKGQSRGAYGKASAVLALYWLGSSGRDLRNLFEPSGAEKLPAPVARAWLATTTARSPKLLPKLQATLVGHPSDDVARLSQFLSALVAGDVHDLGDFTAGARPRWPAEGKFFDARSWLQLELMATGGSAKLREAARQKLPSFGQWSITLQERRVYRRIQAKLRR